MKKIQVILEKKACKNTLWLLLVLLTAAIFLFPTHLTLEYHSIQSAYIFDSLPLFGAVYFIWVLVALTLLFSLRGEEKPAWQKLVLTLIFALVFSGFWVSITHGHYGEVFRYATHIETLQREGNVLAVGYSYFNFPGLFILGSALCQITGLATFDAITLFLVLNILLLATLLFIFFRNCLKNTFLASLATLLVLQGDMMITKGLPQFHPALLGLLYFALFLVLLTRDGKPLFSSWKSYLIFIILLVATTITHFVTSYMLLLVLLGVFIVQKIGKENLVRIATIVLCIAIPLVWMICAPSGEAPTIPSAETPSGEVPTIPSVETPSGEAPTIPSAETPSGEATPITPYKGFLRWPAQVIENFSSGQIASGYIIGLAGTYFGGRAPPWAATTRIFWITLIVVFGSVLGLRNLIKAKQLSSAEKRGTGGLIGMMLLGIVVALSARGEEAPRFLVYTPLFAVPILLRFLFHSERFAKRALPILLILFLTLSLPTFLAHNSTISMNAQYPHELASGEFLKANYGHGEDLHVYFVNYASMTMDSAYYYVQKAYFRDLSAQRMSVGAPEADYWRGLDGMVTDFRGEKDTSIFVFSDRIKLTFQHLLGVDPTTRPQWEELKSKLSQENMIYNNGHVQYFLNH